MSVSGQIVYILCPTNRGFRLWRMEIRPKCTALTRVPDSPTQVLGPGHSDFSELVWPNPQNKAIGLQMGWRTQI